MNDPRVTERRNPLVDKLNRIAEANAQFGTRATGGGAPITEETPLGPAGGSGTVLPPPPRPIDDEVPPSIPPNEVADLEAEWQAQQEQRFTGRPAAPTSPYPRPTPLLPHQPRGAMGYGTPARIDLVTGEIVTSNGQTFPVEPVTLRELKIYAFNATVLAMQEVANQSVAAMREALGISAPGEPANTGATNEKVRKVRGGKAPDGVRKQSNKQGRKAVVVPPVSDSTGTRKPRKARAAKAVQSDVEGNSEPAAV